jgi:hypothetical protein
VPKNADGSIDYGAMRDALFKHGELGQGTTIDNLDLARQQLKFGQQQSQGIQSFEQGGQPRHRQPAIANRSASTPVAPPLNRGGVDNQAGGPGGHRAAARRSCKSCPRRASRTINLAASASIARQLGVDDPTQPIDTNDPRVRNVLVPAVQHLKRAGVGRVIPEGEPSPPDQAAAAARGAPVLSLRRPQAAQGAPPAPAADRPTQPRPHRKASPAP